MARVRRGVSALQGAAPLLIICTLAVLRCRPHPRPLTAGDVTGTWRVASRGSDSGATYIFAAGSHVELVPRGGQTLGFLEGDYTVTDSTLTLHLAGRLGPLGAAPPLAITRRYTASHTSAQVLVLRPIGATDADTLRQVR